ncbi:hypothetical protein [Sphingomonas abaci]|uniref:Uncharacterized protein n=1 Tax=Sphingomonas abaci TaxID=237611 RepID=A0A7W7F0B2_9SPHN|nr:hypothetical protein [Sphingomonas abaci]MBB4619984.1 hypothetical protein [Sphingomonas abaci]
MALPDKAQTFVRRMDPRDELDLYPVLTQGDALRDILQVGEKVTRFAIGLSAEAVAAGLQIGDEDQAPRYADLVFYARLRIAPEQQGAAIFLGKGVVLPVEVTFSTDIDDRLKTYSFGVLVVKK